MPTAYAYVRYSSALQSEGDSVERQTTPLTLFAQRFGVEVSETFIDEGVSSFHGDNIRRGRFRDLLDKIENGEIARGDFLVIESIDRISRQQMDETATQLYEILRKGIKIYTTADERLYSIEDKNKDIENYMMIGLIAKRANEESEMKSRRRRSAWRKAKKLAREEQKVFSGSQNTPYGLCVKNGQFEIIEEEAKEIRLIFELLKYQGVSKTVREVNQDSKRVWANRHVHLMIQNKYVIGVYRAQRRENGRKVFEENIEGYYPQIVSAKSFYEAVDAMKSRATKTHYGNESTGSLNIFKHCIKCSNCGASMRFYRGKNSKGTQYCYIACMNKKEHSRGCREQAFRFDYAVGTLLRYLKALYCQHLEGLEYEGGERLLESFQKADSLFLDMMRRPKRENRSEAENKRLELAQAESVLLNFQESIGTFDGKIPSFVMKSLGEAEDKVAELKRELDATKTKEESLDIFHFDEFLSLLYTERGRQRINRFFKQNEYFFHFEYRKDLNRTVFMKVKKGTTVVGAIGEAFRLHKPLLNEFGIENYNELQ